MLRAKNCKVFLQSCKNILQFFLYNYCVKLLIFNVLISLARQVYFFRCKNINKNIKKLMLLAVMIFTMKKV